MGKIARRTFLIGAAVAGGGLLVGGYAASREWSNPLLAEGALPDGSVPITPFVSVDADGAVTVYVPRAEMGQGVQTTLAAFVAEEMGLTLDEVSVNHGPASGAYYNAAMLREGGPFAFFNERLTARATRSAFGAAGFVLGLQVTGGSSSARDGFVKMREAGAAALDVLRRAAADEFGVATSDLVQEGRAFRSGDRLVGFGEIAANAAALSLPSKPKLTERANWRLLGRSQPRVDVPAKVFGAATFGIDVDLSDMLHATVRMPTALDQGTPRGDEAAAAEVEGVEAIVRIAHGDREGFAVLASNTWSAFRAAELLDPVWERAAARDGEPLDGSLGNALETGEGFTLGATGNADKAIAQWDGKVLEAEYGAPYLAHATMEPMNGTARVLDGRCDVWVGTQAPTIVKDQVADALGMDAENVAVHTQLLGGGFGRRGEFDYAVLAALVAAKAEGRPVKVTWTREEDMTHDMYRPAALARYRAAVDADGRPVALGASIAVPSVMRSMMTRTYPNLPVAGPDRLMVEGAFDQPYDIPDIEVRGIDAPTPLQVGFWRAVGNSHNCFFHESFLDECAGSAARDPLALRLDLAAPWDAATRTLRTVAEMADWGLDMPGRAKGLAFCLSFGTWVAQVVEVEDRDGEIALTRGWCAAEIGTALDPDNIATQLRGGMVFGLSAAMGQAITVEDGRLAQTNYDRYDALRLGQAPPIEVKVLQEHPKMGGAGEPGVPPAAPALGNAIHALTGRRLRTMPFDRDVQFVGW